MDASIVQLNGKTFMLKFGMKVFRLLGEKLKTPTLLTTQQKVLSVLGGMKDDMSFEQLNMINFLILSCIEAESKNTETITEDELEELYLSDTKNILGIMTLIMTDFARSLPQPDKSPQPNKNANSGKLKAPVKKVSRTPKKK